MPMGLNYINAILDCIQSRKYCEAINDDLLLFTPMKSSHFAKLDLLKALCKNGLKIFPKKSQLFKTELQYMGNTIFIRDKRVCVKPLRSRIEAIQKLKPPTTIKGCRSFAGMVNFVSIFCLELQKLLKPIYDLTRKKKQFIWGKNNRMPLKKLKVDYKDPQFCIYQKGKEDFSYTLTQANLPLVVHCIKSKMDIQSSLPTQTKECQAAKKLFYHGIRYVWFGNEYCKLCTCLEES